MLIQFVGLKTGCSRLITKRERTGLTIECVQNSIDSISCVNMVTLIVMNNMLTYFLVGAALMLPILLIVSSFTGHVIGPKRLLLASITFGALQAIPIPIPLIGAFIPAIGMYVVLLANDYEHHGAVLKLSGIALFIYILIFFLVIVRLVADRG